ADKVFNQDLYFKKTVKYVGEPMTHLESIASSAVRAAIKVKASVIICFTSSGRAARLIAKYRPTMPVISVVIPRLKTNQLRWSFSGAFEARQSLIVRGLFPMLADPRHPAESTSATNESVLKVALDHGKTSGVIKSHDRVVFESLKFLQRQLFRSLEDWKVSSLQFMQRLPKKCLAFSQSLINTNHVKESELASLFGKLKYEENLINNIYDTNKEKTLVPATPLSTAFFSSYIVQDFQDSPDDEEDTRSN
ncbi:pyruvate kinase 1, cytosolic, partial [Tanacetum coccineum]